MSVSQLSSNGEDELAFLHERLAAHFGELREGRNETGSPIFALEHGLSQPELALLKTKVASAISDGQIPREFWLPLVVYATEIGYDYAGDEYWHTFESRTPSWVEHGDRAYIRRRFVEFREAFAGAEPTGPWAVHFSIICWPITHAVLPTDLQRHLARLLFENRRALTADLLADPDELGKHLAARAWHASSRFQNFAQNTGLLGRVASALLVGESEHSSYLLESTLSRIVGDLSAEREAGQWLRGAKTSAAHARTRGFRGAGGRLAGRSASGSRVSLAPAADPAISLREDEGGWDVYLEFPDLSVLAERFPDVGDELNLRRAQIAGVAGAPLARGRLLYPGQRVRLSEWPDAGAPLVQLEGGTTATNSLLSEQCVLSAGPVWLFRIRGGGVASEVRGNSVRPGRRYVVLSRQPLGDPVPSWIEETRCATDAVYAYGIVVPAVLDTGCLNSLQAIGIGAVTDVEIRPAGFAAALWDGEGGAEWLAGERPLLAVSSTRAPTDSVWVLDGDPHLMSWPVDERRMFVQLDDLEVGAHDLDVSLVAAGQDEPIATGSFTIGIRPPQARPTSGTYREGLMILATPVSPTLTELWDGRAVVQVRGPSEVEVDVEMSLMGRSREVMAHRSGTTRLPVEPESWARVFGHLLRQDRVVQGVYDDAETCLISISHQKLGSVSLRCERDFAALRWAAARDGDGPFLRLIDNTEGGDSQMELFEFAHPDRPIEPEIDGRSRVRSRSGGLVMARAGSATATMILPPLVRRLEDLGLVPRLSARSRSVREVLDLIRLAEAWVTASLPSDPVGEHWRVKVLRALTGHLASLIGGKGWARLEDRIARDTPVDVSSLQGAIGMAPYQRALARELGRDIDGLRSAKPDERAHVLAQALAVYGPTPGVHGDDHRVAEFLLRLASEPGSLTPWSHDELESRLGVTLASPVLLRAARFMVIAVDALERPSAAAAFGGWAWD